MEIVLMDKTSPKQLLQPLIIAISGLIFCIAAQLGGADGLCVTQGCNLYKDVALFGFSLWWWGAGTFAILALTMLFGAGWLAFWGAFLALAGDCVFVAWMAASAPCVNCMIVGLIFLGLLLSLAVYTNSMGKAPITLACIWLILFSPNVFALGSEMIGPWAIRGSEQAPVRLYFSPSCQACREAVKRLTANGESNIAFFPIAENEADQDTLLALDQELSKGGPFAKAFNHVLNTPQSPQPHTTRMDRIRFRLRLFRNKLSLLRMGAKRIPVIVSYGLAKSNGSDSAGNPVIPSGGAGGFSGCTEGASGQEDCD